MQTFQLLSCSLLQLAVALPHSMRMAVHQHLSGAAPGDTGPGSLAFMHVPFNFGHTVERVAMFPDGVGDLRYFSVMARMGGLGFSQPTLTRAQLNREKQPGGILWGRMDPDLEAISSVTGCPLYFTPQKYWPTPLAEKYFGQAKIFGLLRDPFERLVSMFRGGISGYGDGYDEAARAACDVDLGVRQMMESYLNSSDKFASNCALLPQAEYFDGAYGLSAPLDNRLFPNNVNSLFEEYGYPFHVNQSDILHVQGCQEKWAGDLQPETRALVKQVYARDFDLICQLFGHCDTDENTCLRHVNGMCPSRLFAWNAQTSTYMPQ